MACVGLQYVIVIFPGHTHFLKKINHKYTTCRSFLNVTCTGVGIVQTPKYMYIVLGITVTENIDWGQQITETSYKANKTLPS